MAEKLDLYDLRRREVQALGAALSCHNWHMMEQAYNSLRDKLDAAGFWHRPATPDRSDDALAEENRRLREALTALVERRFAPDVSDLVMRSLPQELRRRAEMAEQVEREWDAARAALKGDGL